MTTETEPQSQQRTRMQSSFEVATRDDLIALREQMNTMGVALNTRVGALEKRMDRMESGLSQITENS